jgi:hypothetical protein
MLDYPRDLAFARGLHAGRLDLWNPMVSCGAPLSVEHGGFFFPLKLPFYLAPSRLTYNLFLTLRLFVAGLGAYLLARRRGLERAPATAAGMAFEMAGTTVWAIPFASVSAPFLLPWVILGSFAIADSRSPAAAAGTALALGITGNSGHAPTSLMVFAAFGMAIIGHVAASWREPRQAIQIAAWALLASLLGALIAAPSVLPLAELSSLGSGYKSRLDGILMRKWKLIEARASLRSAAFASAFSGTAPASAMLSEIGPVMGVVGVSFAIVGLLRGRIEAALLTVATLGVALALVPPGLRWLVGLPGLRLILATYAWPLVLLPLAQAAGEGVRALSAPGGSRVGTIAVALVAAAAWVVSADARPPGDLLRPEMSVALPSWRLLAPALIAVFVVAASVVLRRTLRASLVAALLAATLAAELLSTMTPLARHRPSGVFFDPPSPPVAFLQDRLGAGEARMVALPFEVGYPHTPMVFGLPDVRGVGPVPIRRYYEYRRAISPKAATFTLHDVPVIRSALLDLAAVRYVVLPTVESSGEAWSRPTETDPGLTVVYRGEHVAIYENPAAAARVRIVHRSIVVPTEQEAYRKLREIGSSDGHAADLGLLDAAILEPGDERSPPRALAGSGSAQEYVRIVSRRGDPDELEIETRVTAPAYVVIADTYYPGWKAWVDGHPSPIYPAHLLFRAVFVDQGNHRIVLRFQPTSFRLGVALFAVGLVLCFFLVLRSVHKDAPRADRRAG